MPFFHRVPPRRRPAVWFAGLVLLAAPLTAFAQDNPLTGSPGQAAPTAQGGEETSQAEAARDAEAVPPSATEIIRSLAPFADGNPNAPRDQRDVDADGRRKVRVDYGHAIDLTVFFKYDSAELTPEAKIQLEPLGNALRSRELAPYSFLIAGHTDAAGNASYNLDLSKRRAEAVRRHLLDVFAIDPARLLTRGWGAGRLKDVERPLAGVNRRVEVVLIVPERRSFLADEPGFEFAGAVEAEMLPSEARGWQVVGRPHGSATHLVDPRSRLSSDALDDFHATPTSLCMPRARTAESGCIRAWHDPGRGEWFETRD